MYYPMLLTCQMYTDTTASANDILIFEKVCGGVRNVYGH